MIRSLVFLGGWEKLTQSGTLKLHFVQPPVSLAVFLDVFEPIIDWTEQLLPLCQEIRSPEIYGGNGLILWPSHLVEEKILIFVQHHRKIIFCWHLAGHLGIDKVHAVLQDLQLLVRAIPYKATAVCEIPLPHYGTVSIFCRIFHKGTRRGRKQREKHTMWLIILQSPACSLDFILFCKYSPVVHLPSYLFLISLIWGL